MNKPVNSDLHLLKDDGTFPNNHHLPVIVYKGVLTTTDPSEIEALFHDHQWGNAWRNGIFNYHHYHSTAHEVLGIYEGEGTLLLGGPDGVSVQVKPGDVIIIPAGVAHKNVNGSHIKCVGAYPKGQNYDIKYGKKGERPLADHNISNVPLPSKDPVFGKVGELVNAWKN